MDDLDWKNGEFFEAASEALYQIKIKELQNALWFAAGYISTTERFLEKSPQECLGWILDGAKK